MKRWKWVAMGVLAVAQLIRPARTAEPLNASTDLIAVTRPSTQVEHLLRVACYDCHSGQPRYPWYMNITPVNWWMQHHINESRKHFDVSAWGRVTEKRRAHWAEEAMEMLSDEKMPLPSFTWIHADARLTGDERRLLIDFCGGLK